MLDAAYQRGRDVLADDLTRMAELDMLGRQRELTYKTLVLTGPRKGELASLTVGQIVLDGPHPFAELLAKDEKAGRGAKIPHAQRPGGRFEKLSQPASACGTAGCHTIGRDNADATPGEHSAVHRASQLYQDI